MPFTWMFALTGAVQGWALWGLWKLHQIIFFDSS